MHLGGGHQRHHQRGLTLVEMSIVVAIIALTSGVMVMSVAGTSVAELRSTTARLSGFLRACYDDAALSGKTVRVAIDFAGDSDKEIVGDGGAHVLVSHATDDVMALDLTENTPAFAHLAGEDGEEVSKSLADLAAELPPKEGQDEEDNAAGLEMVAAMFGNSGQSKGPVTEASLEELRRFDLGEEIRILDIWVQGMDRPTAEGKAFIHFFPHGYTQDAVINVAVGTDAEQEVFGLRLHALTGRTEVEPGYMEAPK